MPCLLCLLTACCFPCDLHSRLRGSLTHRQGCRHHPVRLPHPGSSRLGPAAARNLLVALLTCRLPRRLASFMYDGEVVRDDDTPGSLSMEDSDTVEVVLER